MPGDECLRVLINESGLAPQKVPETIALDKLFLLGWRGEAELCIISGKRLDVTVGGLSRQAMVILLRARVPGDQIRDPQIPMVEDAKNAEYIAFWRRATLRENKRQDPKLLYLKRNLACVELLKIEQVLSDNIWFASSGARSVFYPFP